MGFAADGLPEPRAELMPDQQAIRNACIEFFDSDVYRMAEKIGYRPQSVYGWIEGTRVPGRRVFEKLMRALRLDSFADLWMPDPTALYFHGVRITPRDRVFRSLESKLVEAVKHSDPVLARRLRL